MTDIRAQLSDALRDHRFERWSPESFSRCACGQRFEWPRSDHPEHLADVLLSLPGIAIVELPERTTIPDGWRGDNCLGAWPGPVCEDPVSAWRTSRYDHDAIAMPGGDFITIEDARALAAALLAAANAAEQADADA